MSPKKKVAKSRLGRPPGPVPGMPRERLFFRADAIEVKRWTAAADELGVALSTWIRLTCNTAARR